MSVIDLERKQTGAAGLTFVVGAGEKTFATGKYYAIQCVTACTFSVLTMHNSDGDDVTTVVFPAGMVIMGDVATVTAGANDTYILYRN